MDLRECRVAERFCEVDSVNFSAQRTASGLTVKLLFGIAIAPPRNSPNCMGSHSRNASQQCDFTTP